MDPVETFLNEFTPAARQISLQLRAMIKNAIPEAKEKVYYGWRGVGYRHPQAGYFCCIFPFPDVVKLAFEHGALLADPDGLLEMPPTSGKQLRYMRFEFDQPVAEDEVVGFLHAAILARS